MPDDSRRPISTPPSATRPKPPQKRRRGQPYPVDDPELASPDRPGAEPDYLPEGVGGAGDKPTI
jgi:hypothetical protein